jgi:hypothetical protein
MTETAGYQPLAALAGLDADHPLVELAEAERARLMQRLRGTATVRERWLVELCVQRAVQLEAALSRIEAALLPPAKDEAVGSSK